MSQEKEVKCSRSLDLFKGLANFLVFTNIYSGRGTLGDKIIERIMPESGPVDRPEYFFSGFVAGFGIEVSLLASSLYSVYSSDYEILALNVGIKTLPRIAEHIARDFTSKKPQLHQSSL